jgi:hypothetical protein
MSWSDALPGLASLGGMSHPETSGGVHCFTKSEGLLHYCTILTGQKCGVVVPVESNL